MLFSRLHFSSELTSCRHWWLAWGKWNALWHFVYKPVLLTSFHAWNTDCAITCGLRCSFSLFCVKTSSKRKGWSRSLALRAAVWTEAFIQRSVRHITEHQNGIYCLNFLKKITIWNIRLCFLSKETVYKTGNFQWAVRPLSKIFGTNTCSLPFHPLYIYTHTHIVFSLYLNHCPSILNGFKDMD